MSTVIIATLAARSGKNEQKGSIWASHSLGYQNCGKRIEAEAHMYKVIPTKSMISIDLKPPRR